MNPFADLEEWSRWVAFWRQHDDEGHVVSESLEIVEARALERAARSDATWDPFGFDVPTVRATHKSMWEKLRAQISSGEKAVYGYHPASGEIRPIDPRVALLLTIDLLKRTAVYEGLVVHGIEIRLRSEALIDRTGAPGRPTKSMHLVLNEARRRLAEGRLEESQEAAATSLRAWLRDEHPEAPPPGIKSITNQLAKLRPRRAPVPAKRP